MKNVTRHTVYLSEVHVIKMFSLLSCNVNTYIPILITMYSAKRGIFVYK